MNRPNLDEYFMTVAVAAALRSTCPRGSCGAVVAGFGKIISAGYNGAPPNMPHCDEVGCDLQVVRDRERCVRVIHAERNALARSAGRGDALYSTSHPCFECLKEILAHPEIQRVVWLTEYPDPARDALETEVLQRRRLRIARLTLKPYRAEEIADALTRKLRDL